MNSEIRIDTFDSHIDLFQVDNRMTTGGKI